jgi:Flp pilus assembly protein TadG
MKRPEVQRGDTGDRRSKQGGSTLVEFALVVPLFFLIVFGLVEFGIIFAGYCSAAYASQLAVRYAIVHGVNSSNPVSVDSAAMKTLVVPFLWAAQTNSSTITINWNPDDSVGSTVTVNISLTYSTGIPYSSLKTVKVGATAQGTVLF